MTGEQLPFYPDKPLNDHLATGAALKAARVGIWAVDPATRTIHLDEQCQALLGLTKTGKLSYKRALSLIHPDDAARVVNAVKWAMNPQSGGS